MMRRKIHKRYFGVNKVKGPRVGPRPPAEVARRDSAHQVNRRSTVAAGRDTPGPILPYGSGPLRVLGHGLSREPLLPEGLLGRLDPCRLPLHPEGVRALSWLSAGAARLLPGPTGLGMGDGHLPRTTRLALLGAALLTRARASGKAPQELRHGDGALRHLLQPHQGSLTDPLHLDLLHGVLTRVASDMPAPGMNRAVPLRPPHANG